MGQCCLDKELDALSDGLSADGTGLKCSTALYTRCMSTLKHKFNVVVNADGTRDALLHLSVAGLQLLQKVVLLRVFCPGTGVHFCLVWERNTEVRSLLSATHPYVGDL